MDWWNNFRAKSKDPRIRRKVIESLNLEGEVQPATIELIAAGLGDEDAGVRAAAATAMGSTGNERATESLLPLLRDANPEVRRAAVMGLGQVRDGRASAAVATLLHDVSASVRQGAALALERMGWRPSSEEEQASYEIALGNTRAASLKGQAAVNPLLSELGDKAESLRRAAAEALEGVDDPRRVKPLLQAAADPEPNVRVSAIHALAKAGGDQVTEVLLRGLRDPDCHVRLAAAVVLGRRDNPEFVPQLIPLLTDSYYEVRLTVVQFLGRVRQPESVPPLLPRLKDSDSDVRIAVAKALGEIGSPDAIEALVMALIDDEKTVRHFAGLSLNQIDANWTQSEAAKRACAALEKSMQDRPAWVRASVSDVINKLRQGSGGTPSEAPKEASQETPRIELKMAAPDLLGNERKRVVRR